MHNTKEETGWKECRKNHQHPEHCFSGITSFWNNLDKKHTCLNSHVLMKRNSIVNLVGKTNEMFLKALFNIVSCCSPVSVSQTMSEDTGIGADVRRFNGG